MTEQKQGGMRDGNVATAWQVSPGPIKADRYTLEAAKSIDASTDASGKADALQSVTFAELAASPRL